MIRDVQPLARVLYSALAIVVLVLSTAARAEDLRNVKHGEPVPTLKAPTVDGSVVSSESMKGSVIVYVCLSAEQKRSEQAAIDSQLVFDALGDTPARLIHVTSDVVQKAYFQALRTDHGIRAPLAFDADRAFYATLGLIAFPTTVIVDKEGKLNSVILLHGSDYKNALDAHVRHAMGTLSDEELKDRLAARTSEKGSPKSAASAHRALARLMRDKGQFQEARSELIKGLELDPGNHEMMLDMVEVDLAMNAIDSADSIVATVLAAQPDHRRAMQFKGIILFRRGQLDEAQAILEKALPLNPSPEVVHYYLGQIMERKGDKDKAIEHYRESLRHFMKEPQAQPAKPD